MRTTLAFGVLWAVLIIGAAATAGVVIAMISEREFASVLLAIAPGGMAR